MHRTILVSARHARRRCVGCGLAAEAITATQVHECPRCGCDLLARPPRSYAEMEGLDTAPEPAAAADAMAAERTDAAATRWMLVVGAIALLAVAAVLVPLLLAAG
jgi:hypothetical protein